MKMGIGKIHTSRIWLNDSFFYKVVASLVMNDGTIIQNETGPYPTYQDGTKTTEHSLPGLPNVLAP